MHFDVWIVRSDTNFIIRGKGWFIGGLPSITQWHLSLTCIFFSDICYRIANTVTYIKGVFYFVYLPVLYHVYTSATKLNDYIEYYKLPCYLNSSLNYRLVSLEISMYRHNRRETNSHLFMNANGKYGVTVTLWRYCVTKNARSISLQAKPSIFVSLQYCSNQTQSHIE